MNRVPRGWEAILAEPEETLLWLLAAVGLIPPRRYRKCDAGNMFLVSPLRPTMYRSAKGCRATRSIFTCTIFAHAKLPLNKLVHMAHLWICGGEWGVVVLTLGVANATAGCWLNFFNKVVEFHMNADPVMIGGVGIIVEIDETNFGKRKYNRGHRVEKNQS